MFSIFVSIIYCTFVMDCYVGTSRWLVWYYFVRNVLLEMFLIT